MAGRSLQDYMCRYMDEKSDNLKGCLVAALENQEGFLCLLVESLGTPIESDELQYSDLLTNAGLFWAEERITRNGRNKYRLFHLTDAGRHVAELTMKEGFTGKVAENAVLA